MNRIKLGRPSPALVIACIALFVAMGGVGYAAATGSIDGREIKNNSVASGDIKNSSIAGKDVKNSALTGSDVKANSLNGTDIAESSLGKVASAGTADSAATAASAGNANTVGGTRVIPFSFRSDTTATQKTLATVNGAEVIVGCGGADPDLNLKNVSGGTAELNISNVFLADNTTETVVNKAFANNTAQQVAFGGVPEDGASGQTGFVGASGKPVRLQYSLNRNVNGFDCSINGVIIG